MRSHIRSIATSTKGHHRCPFLSDVPRHGCYTQLMKALLHSLGSVVISLALLLAPAAYGRPAIVECLSETGETSAKFWEDMAYSARGQADPERVEQYERNAAFCADAAFGRKAVFVFGSGLAGDGQPKDRADLTYYTLCGAVEVEEAASVKSKQDEITVAYYDQTTRRMRYFVIDLSEGLGGFGERRDFQCSEKKIERSGQLF